jgi:TetR/AcrR family transcriptional regulator, mexCD-oprJ operon repressor
MPPPAVDHRRAAAERSVAAILDAAERLLSRGAGVSILAVAQEAGVSRPTVYAHYPKLGDLVAAVVERAVQSTVAAIASAEVDDGPALDALDRLLAAGWRELDRHAAIARAAAEHLAPDQLRHSHEPFLVILEGLVARGREEGAFRTDLPATWLVTTAFALVHAAGDDVRAGRLDSEQALDVLRTTMHDVFVGRC